MFFRIAWSTLAVAAVFAVFPVWAQAEGYYYADESQCDECLDDLDICPDCKCPRPVKVKVVIRRPLFAKCPFRLPPPPPQGFATASVAAVMVPTFAVPATAAVTVPASPAQAGLSDDVIRRLAAEMKRQDAASAPAAAAAGDPKVCKDPCGDIKQLQQDVASLIKLTNELADAVGVLARERKRASAPQPTP